MTYSPTLGSRMGLAKGTLALSRTALFEIWRRKGVRPEPDADHYAGVCYTYPVHLAATLAPYADSAARRQIRARALYIAGSRLFSSADPIVRKVQAELGMAALGINGIADAPTAATQLAATE